MEQRRIPEYTLEIFADPTCVKDMIKGVLHTIFFHRTFPAIRPLNRELLEITLPAIDDVDLETLIDQRATTLVRQIDAPFPPSQSPHLSPFQQPSAPLSSPSSAIKTKPSRGQLHVQFYEKRRRKSYFSFTKANDEEVCWEQWTLDVTLAKPRNEEEGGKVRQAMERSLQKAAMKVVSVCSEEREHIPPITTSETNPFPYQILVGAGRGDSGWGRGRGIF